MKLTTARLKKLIREELEKMQENVYDMSKMNAMEKISYYIPQALDDLDKEYGTKGRREREEKSYQLKAVAAEIGGKEKTDEITDDEAIEKLKVEFRGNPDIMSMIRYGLKAMGK